MSLADIYDDGFTTTISLGGVDIEWKEVQPPGISGGGGINNTTMENVDWRTMSPKQLKSLTEISGNVAYSFAAYATLLAAINVNQEITVTLPDGATIVFWGWLDEFQPDSNQEGEQPMASIKIIPSNRNATRVVTPPEFNAPTP